MMKKLLFLLFLTVLCEPALAAYRYTYIPKTSSPTIYNFLYRKREKCQIGESATIRNRSASALPAPTGRPI